MTTTEQLITKLIDIDGDISGTNLVRIVALIQRENRAFSVELLEKLKKESGFRPARYIDNLIAGLSAGKEPND